tara:strand:+ start:659 stop:1447 length:789 start_codon:yes stop_codon:yes gene_type:complete
VISIWGIALPFFDVRVPEVVIMEPVRSVFFLDCSPWVLSGNIVILHSGVILRASRFMMFFTVVLMLNILIGIWLRSFLSRGWRWFCGLFFFDFVTSWGILLEFLLIHVLGMFLGPVYLLSLHVSSWLMVMRMTMSSVFNSSICGIIISLWRISLKFLFVHLFFTFIIPISISVILFGLMFLGDLRFELELLITSWRVLDILWIVDHGVSLSILEQSFSRHVLVLSKVSGSNRVDSDSSEESHDGKFVVGLLHNYINNNNIKI